jgi:hypothetical protein
MLQCIYIISFLCLLRFDEVLKIQAHHLEVVEEASGQIRLTLPFRKTHKFGGNLILPFKVDTNDLLEVKPFYFHHDPKERHMDPIHAILRWMELCEIKEGYIFRRFTVDDRISPENKPLV